MKPSDRILRPVAGSVSRRDVLRIFPALAGWPLIGNWLKRRAKHPWPGCVVVPQQTEGPYFADVRLNRSDIRTEPSDGSVCAGMPLRLELNVSHIASNQCSPLPGAIVDIWQCDAHGRYSAFRDTRAGFDTRTQTFLRGYQITDQIGAARFVTVVPGWYRGRAIHIHFKVRTDPEQNSGYEFTSQLYFEEALAASLESQAKYADNTIQRMTNARDRIYRRGGDRLTLSVTEEEDGLSASFAIGLKF